MTNALRIVRNDSGTAVLEFALILPLLLGLLAGIFAYGRVLLTEQAVRDVIDSAVRRGIVAHLSANAVSTQVESGVAIIPGLEDFSVSVNDGAALSVTVSGSFHFALAEMLPASAMAFHLTTQLPR